MCGSRHAGCRPLVRLATLRPSLVRPMPDALSPGAAHAFLMIRNPDHQRRATPEERSFLDALVFWRKLYAERGPQDREPIESLADAIAEAEGRMKSLRLEASA